MSKTSEKIYTSTIVAKVSLLDLLPSNTLSKDFEDSVSGIDYSSATTKINLALNSLPSLSCIPSTNKLLGHHGTTIHLGAASLKQLNDSFIHARSTGTPSPMPMIEMTIPTAFDKSLAPPGHHVATLFIQWTPYSYFADKERGRSRKTKFTKKVINIIDEYAPGFSQSVFHTELLTPPDLEREFGLTGGLQIS